MHPEDRILRSVDFPGCHFSRQVIGILVTTRCTVFAAGEVEAMALGLLDPHLPKVIVESTVHEVDEPCPFHGIISPSGHWFASDPLFGRDFGEGRLSMGQVGKGK
jgi:hypothetical protein